MTDTITYQYQNASALIRSGKNDELFLSQYSEVQKKDVPCFFWGRLTDPFITARCLITLSNVVRSSFSLSPFEMRMLKDPIVTAGNEKLRFEGFSHCAGVYARVDILEGGHDGEFMENGTTNVDFNQAMISALSSLSRNEQVMLSVGKKEVGLHKQTEKIIERKVPLPVKWIKGLTTVQIYMADADKSMKFNRVQAMQLFQSLPKVNTKTDHYLTMRGGKPFLSPLRNTGSICVGGIHRLRLVEHLLPHINELVVFVHPDMQLTTWQLYFGNVRFSLSLSRDSWRGFSGEGAALESLIEDIPEKWLSLFDNYSYANQQFNPAILMVENDIDPAKINMLAARLSAMGLLGYDLDENHFFYRRLPYKINRILTLNPRLKGANKLLEENKVEILVRDGDKVEASVEGSGVKHTVILQGDMERCTCAWFSKNQGERGICKHVLAVKMKLANG